MAIISINNEWADAETATVTTDNTIVTDGLGFYETFICKGDEPLLWRDHYDCILTAMRTLHFNTEALPQGYELRRRIELLARRNNYPAYSKVKMTVWQTASDVEHIGWTLSMQRMETRPYVLERRPIIAHAFTEARVAPSAFTQVNTCSVVKAMARKAQKINNWDIILLTNIDGNVIGSPDDNIYAISNGKIFTPSLESGAQINAITKTLTDVCTEIGLPVIRISGLSPAFMRNASEIFLAGAANGLTPLYGFEEKRYLVSQIQDINTRIHDKLIF